MYTPLNVHTDVVFLMNYKLEKLILSLLHTQSTESKCFQVEKVTCRCM